MNNEFVSDLVVESAKRHMEDCAKGRMPFMPLAISDTGDAHPIHRKDVAQEDSYRLLGVLAWLNHYQYFVCVMDARIKPSTPELEAIVREQYGPDKRIMSPREGLCDALMFLVIPFTPDVKAATGLWLYSIQDGMVTWNAPAPKISTKVFEQDSIRKWMRSGWNVAQNAGLRMARPEGRKL